MTPLLHVKIPGEPVIWSRHKGSGARSWNPKWEEAKAVRWQIKAASPALKPSGERLAMILEAWSAEAPVHDRKNSGWKYKSDASNMLKFYEDAMTGLVWNDDSQIDDARVIVHRSALEPRIELLVWELP